MKPYTKIRLTSSVGASTALGSVSASQPRTLPLPGTGAAAKAVCMGWSGGSTAEQCPRRLNRCLLGLARLRQLLGCVLRRHVRVEELRYDIEQRTLGRSGNRHAVRPARNQRTTLARALELSGRIFRALVELGHRDAGARRDRPLVQVEDLLELRAHDGFGQRLLSGLGSR